MPPAELFFKPTYGSGVSLKTMSLADAATRLCEHDADELKCPACIRNHDIQMGRAKRMVPDKSNNPDPIYVEWGRPLVNDIVNPEGLRQSNWIRAYASVLGYNLDDTIIDFHQQTHVAEVHVERGVMARQMWLRLPHPPDRRITMELAKLWLETAYPVIESGRRKEWVRTKRLTVVKEESSV